MTLHLFYRHQSRQAVSDKYDDITVLMFPKHIIFIILSVEKRLATRGP